MRQFLAPGDTVRINSSLIIQNVTLRDLDNYSCVAINRGGMAECRTNLALVQVRTLYSQFPPGHGETWQVNYWSEVIEEIIIVLTIMGAIIAFVFSLLVMKILANR